MISNKYALLTFALMLCLALPFVSSAADSLDVKSYEAGKTLDLKIQCLNNGTICSSAATCNLTLLRPDNSLLVDNLLMTRQSSFHNFTIPGGSLWTIGRYPYSANCLDNGVGSSVSDDFDITPSGNKNNLGVYIIVFAAIWIITLFGAYYENYPMAAIGGLGLIAIGIYSMVGGIAEFKNQSTFALSLITLALGAYFSITAGIKQIEESM